jgi:glutamyl-tRNA synthetase
MSVEDLSQRIFDWVDELVLKDFISDRYEETLDWEEQLREEVKKYAPKWKEDEDYFEKLLPLFHERLMYLGELPELMSFFYDEKLEYQKDDLEAFGEGDRASALEVLWDDISPMFQKDWDHDKWEQAVRNRADELGWKHGQLFMLLRVAVTGRKASPPLFDCMKLLGEEKCDKFIHDAIDFLS